MATLPIRLRKLIGTFAIIAFVIVYALLAMRLGVALVGGRHGLLQIIYYVIAGFVWVIPTGLIIRWMQRP